MKGDRGKRSITIHINYSSGSHKSTKI